MMRHFFHNKLIWAGLGLIVLITTIFTFAFMGSTVNPTPVELPIAVVVEDEGAILPNGESMNIGETLLTELKKNESKEVKWHFLSRQEAFEAMNNKEMYATLSLPVDFSRSIISLTDENSDVPTATIIINEGLNFTGANIATTIATNVVTNLNQQVQTQLFQQIEALKVPLSTELALQLANPITIKTDEVNNVAANNANGNTPAIFTQLLWLATFFASMTLYTLIKKETGGTWSASSLVSQLLAGILFVAALSAVTLFLSTQVLKVSVPNIGEFYMLLLFIGLCFFFIQNALLNWIGYPAAPLFILLLFFSMPIMTLAPELLPPVTRDFLYSWVPFRFTVDSLQDYLFFKKELFANGVGAIGIIGLISLLVMELAIFKPVNGRKKDKKLKEQPIHQ
ncbi:YhgE/Pip domain-containing protein [Metabacillus malikii]|uniref:YhgE/Pip-like protein n=1 Tax=Metabacillus malikii TaxID=1504265 RepID=A0ABT9ZC38_9BACI|nr:YhgE/Pip family protein [Metabacillus malikii]MDQ0229829.1 YhgE/Pip-like protein [Metabacillus malikii]